MAGRPREFDRDEALAKARDVFWQHGYQGTSMSHLVCALSLASSRIYAAFGSKENLFREAVELYRSNEGGAAMRVLQSKLKVREGIEAMLRTAITTYTQVDRPQGCMVVTAATNCSLENTAVTKCLTEYRQTRNRAILKRLQKAVEEGQILPETDVQSLADYFGTLLSGLSVQARDGVSRGRLLAMVSEAMTPLDRCRTEV